MQRDTYHMSIRHNLVTVTHVVLGMFDITQYLHHHHFWLAPLQQLANTYTMLTVLYFTVCLLLNCILLYSILYLHKCTQFLH